MFFLRWSGVSCRSCESADFIKPSSVQTSRFMCRDFMNLWYYSETVCTGGLRLNWSSWRFLRLQQERRAGLYLHKRLPDTTVRTIYKWSEFHLFVFMGRKKSPKVKMSRKKYLNKKWDFVENQTFTKIVIFILFYFFYFFPKILTFSWT